MLIFDYQQIAIANLMEQIKYSNAPVNEDLVRHMILNTLRKYVFKFREEYGPEVVIACDNKNYWRREIFPQYKAARKKSREDSGLDWNTIFACLNLIREELKDFCPYKVIDIETCEADDIIGVLIQEKYELGQKHLIISGDKDFIQLQKYPGVVQYSPILKKFIKSDDPDRQLKELVIRGDKNDGIPNILSKDDCFITGTRQKQIREVTLEEWLIKEPEQFCTTDEMLRNYHRNRTLINLECIPSKQRDMIINTYNNVAGKPKQTFMYYMISKRINNLIESINEF